MAEVSVVVRYFAAARAAAGVGEETLTLPPGATVGALTATLGARDAGLAIVLARCSLLCDGVAIRDDSIELPSSAVVDVLPPFAGG